ncbi:MAG: DUF1189 family protein [Thermodesulfobacteriota bacterium]
MGITKAVYRMPTLLVVLVLLGAVVLSAVGFLGFLSTFTPRVEQWIDHVISEYDAYVPEIAIRKGKAEINRKQPYIVDMGDSKEGVIVIDTTIESVADGMKHLNNVESGFVLTRTALLTKSSHQIRVISLDKLPDMDINGARLGAWKNQYFPMLVPTPAFWSNTGATVYFLAACFYFVCAKAFQVLILSLLPLFLGPYYSVRLGYGESLKIAVFCLVPPVVVDFLLGMVGSWSWWTFGMYLLIYVAALVLAVMDLAGDRDISETPQMAIHP